MKKLIALAFVMAACGDDIHNVTTSAPQAPQIPQRSAPAPQPEARTIEPEQIFPSITLAWDPNPESNLAGYRIYVGLTTRDYNRVIDVGNVTMVHVPDLEYNTTYYFTATAYNDAGLESDFSNEVIYRTPPKVATPPLEPRITKVTPPPGNGDHFGAVEIQGGSLGVNYVLQASSDLATWVDVETFRFNVAGEIKKLNFDADALGASNGRLFFRIRWETGTPSAPQL